PRDEAEALAHFWSKRLIEKDHFAEAATAFSLFALSNMDDEITALELANHYLNAHKLDKVEEILDDVVEKFGDGPTVHAMTARIEITRGNSEAAKSAALKAIELNARAIPAYVILSELDPRLIDASIQNRLSAVLRDESLPAEMRVGGYRTLGRVFEKRGDIDAAFAAFAAAKSLAKENTHDAGRAYNPTQIERRTRIVAARYPSVIVESDDKHRRPLSVFIIGMPRSGSTLVDQIISRHSRAISIGESSNILQIANWIDRKAKASGRTYRSCVADIREHYRSVYSEAAQGAACIIDKNLFNFERCGLIADLDPQARFILTLRDPADIALSIFRTKFLAAHEWSHDLRDIAHMQATFEFLTGHWRRILGDRIHVVKHEELVADFEPGVRALLDFCGLDFEPQCLEFHKGDRKVFTTSAAQVRRPVNAEGVGRWRRYEKHLAPYFEGLEEFRRRYAQG
ncbi:MAG TPA: sulfotransferase, partial [Parvularculaceae bacterium]|nr:sulfotransferase [Parvularculaceae bacterium]